MPIPAITMILAQNENNYYHLLTSFSPNNYISLYSLFSRLMHKNLIPGVFRATVIAKLTYCAPSWSGACSAADRARLESFVSRCKRLEYCSSEVPTYSDLTDEADDTLFSRIMANHGHVLQPLLPDRHSIPYSLRERSHNKTLLNKSTHLNNGDFLIRMLYKDSY